MAVHTPLRLTRLSGLVFLLAFGPAAAAGDPAAGKDKASQICAACHKAAGEGDPSLGYPALAGQYASYLSRALRDYRSGARKNAIMNGLAQPLGDQEIDDLAAYYAALEGRVGVVEP